MNTLLADAILVLHAAFVLFVVLGLPAIWIGAWLNRPFARNRWFRGLHLAAIGIVVLEVLVGVMCPLTVWENALRGVAQDQGFIQRWIHAWLYWNLPNWIFGVAYTAFGALVALTWWLVPPRRASRSRAPPSPPR